MLLDSNANVYALSLTSSHILLFFFFLNLFLNSLTEVTSAQPTPVYGAKGINATYEAEQMQK